MPLPFHAPWMLLGLAGLAIPVLVHLLNRRRFDAIEWGAMQFLQVSQTTRRRLLLEELLLLLLRLGLIALLVLALAAPFVDGVAAAPGHGNRDVVLIFDGSGSMGYTGDSLSAHDKAKEWARDFLAELPPGDGVALLQARQGETQVVSDLTHDREQLRERLARLPEPAGVCDGPAALQAACNLLATSQRPRRDVILLSDGQRFGWADDAALLRWELLAGQLQGPAAFWYVNLDPDRPANPPNWSLAPLRASRTVTAAGQRITFHTALELHGPREYQPPYQIRLEVNGRPVPGSGLKAPAATNGVRGQVPLTFTHRFAEPGPHRVAVIVEPDPPPGKRPAGYEVKDRLPSDNRRDLALEVVPALPVLLVDGDPRPNPTRRGTDFLHKALAAAPDGKPAVLLPEKDVPIRDFDPALLTREIGAGPGTSPRVLVLSNVERLTPAQREAVARFLTGGGGVLVTLGERVDARHYNEQLYRGGEGWLPARLDETAGNETRPEDAARPLPVSFSHPALELFRAAPADDLGEARFPRWWKLHAADRSPAALLTSNDPLLVERPYGAGRVLLCAVPLDDSWRTNLPQLPAFVALAHELVFYLAGARSAEHNLQPDSRESDLTPCSDADRENVARLLPVRYENDRACILAGSSEAKGRLELGPWLLLGVIVLLCGEVWLTRRLARGK